MEGGEIVNPRPLPIFSPKGTVLPPFQHFRVLVKILVNPKSARPPVTDETMIEAFHQGIYTC